MEIKGNFENLISFSDFQLQSILFINSLDKFDLIHYKGQICPRISLNSNKYPLHDEPKEESLIIDLKESDNNSSSLNKEGSDDFESHDIIKLNYLSDSLQIFKEKEVNTRINIERNNLNINNYIERRNKKNKNLFINNNAVKENLKPNNEDNNNKIFKTMLLKKRGRKQNNRNNKIHTGFDDDNVLRKIQVSFISFIINFVNDIISTFITAKDLPLFKSIDYKLKKNVNHEYFKNLKQLKIADILQMRPSPKLKKHNNDINKNIYNQVCQLIPFMKDFLEFNYINFFKEYFYSYNKIFIINGKEIHLSEKTKTFQDLILKNVIYKEKLINVAMSYFLEKSPKTKMKRFLIEKQMK